MDQDEVKYAEEVALSRDEAIREELKDYEPLFEVPEDYDPFEELLVWKDICYSARQEALGYADNQQEYFDEFE